MKQSSIIGKIVISGKLNLKTPLLIGGGMSAGASNDKDIHVLKDGDGIPFIPGTSLCGVLRDYVGRVNPKIVREIFGDADFIQNSIQFEDIPLKNSEIIFRDGVKIDGCAGTGVDGGKYDY